MPDEEPVQWMDVRINIEGQPATLRMWLGHGGGGHVRLVGPTDDIIEEYELEFDDWQKCVRGMTVVVETILAHTIRRRGG